MASFSEIKQILGRFVLLFPNYNPADIAASAKAWLEIVGHIPGDELMAAALAAAAKPGQAFAPSVGDVMAQVTKMRAETEGVLSAAEAWAHFLDNQHNYKFCSDYRRIFVDDDRKAHLYGPCVECAAPMKPLVRAVVVGLGWPDNYPVDDSIMVDRAHFLKAYELAMAKALDQAVRPAIVTQYIASRTGQAQLPEGK